MKSLSSLRYYQDTIFFLFVVLFLGGAILSQVDLKPQGSYPLKVISESQKDGGARGMTP